jgi:hypothetical protein
MSFCLPAPEEAIRRQASISDPDKAHRQAGPCRKTAADRTQVFTLATRD